MSRRRTHRVPQPVAEPTGLLGDSEPSAMVLGEILRRVSLAMTIALVVARAYWYAEGQDEVESGVGLGWALSLLATSAIAATGFWLAGGLRLRRSWADLAVLILFGLVGLSARWADEKRIAINRAWEWAGVAIAYVLIRNLPRTRRESSAIAGALVATAVALAIVGLYQVRVEHPQARAFFRAHRKEALASAGVDPTNPRSVRAFEDRLLGSREPTATFALANTLAGFLVGPAAIGLALAIRNLRPTKPPTDRLGRLLLATPLFLALFACLLLTKSRSAYIGLGVAMAIFAYRERRGVSGRSIALAAAGILAIVAAMVVAATFAGQLDGKVLSESSKSLSYRLEYWQATWRVIWDGKKTWWAGLGPGNFADPYLRHKLPQASEEIVDPHNMLLEVWTTAGLPALIALVAALGWGVREAFGRPSLGPGDEPEPDEPFLSEWSKWLVLPGVAAGLLMALLRRSKTSTGLVVTAGLGGWLLVVLFGRINPFLEDRWMVIGVAWLASALLGTLLWNRLPMTGDLLGLGVVAISVNLLAAGGIGFAPVALMLWGLLALALNLSDDRPCGASRRVGGRILAFVPMAVVAALLGTFLGTAVPFWNAEKSIAEGDALANQRIPDYIEAHKAFRRANEIDPLAKRGWIKRATLTFTKWRAEGKPPDMVAWAEINSALAQAGKRPERNPFAIAPQRIRARVAAEFLLQPDLHPTMRKTIRLDRLDACRKCVAFYPNDATLRADYAEALGELNFPVEASAQAVRALELDHATPHADKKLDDAVREALIRNLEGWTAQW